MIKNIKKFNQLSLRKQVAIFVIMAIVVTSLVISVANYLIYENYVARTIESETVRKLEMKKEMFSYFHSTQMEKMEFITSNELLKKTLQDFTGRKISKSNLESFTSKYFNEIFRTNEKVTAIAITDKNGNVLANSSNQFDLGPIKNKIQTNRSLNFSMLGPQITMDNNYSVDVISSIKNVDDKVLGHMAFKINVNNIAKLLTTKSVGPTNFSILFQKNLSDQTIELLIPKKLPDGRGPIIPISEAPKYLLTSDFNQIENFKADNGANFIYEVQNLFPTSWLLVSAFDKDTLYSGFYSNVSYLLTVMLILVAIMVYASYQLTFQVAFPLIKMSEQAKEIAKGNFDVSFYQKDTVGERDPQDELAHSLNDMTKDIKKYIEFRDGFLSLAAHELKAPLSVIQSYLDLVTLEDYKYEENKDDFIRTIQRQCKLLNVLITDLLEVSRIQMGRFKLNKTKENIAETIFQLVEELNTLEQKDRIVLINKIPKSMSFDVERLEQVLLCLISNSIKYSSSESQIFIQMEEVGDNMRISVHDQGSGISKEKQKLIFQQLAKDSQISLAPEKKSKSLGISLYVCKSIVEKHDGVIWFESKENVGTSFHFEIPMYEEQLLKSA